MAKLNNVTVLPAVAERIQYEGKTYVKTEPRAIPKAGDVLRMDKSGYIDTTPGAFYRMKDDYSFVDDERDERDIEYYERADFTVFTPSTPNDRA